MVRSSFLTASALRLASLFLMIGCGPDATAPSDLGTISLLVVSGGGQSGVVGTELPQPLVIKATKSNGAAIVGLTVNFRVTSGGGSMFAGSATTDSKGLAADYWTLGTSTAQAQSVEVRAVLASGQKQVYGVFTATALPGPAAQIAVQAGGTQTARAGTNVLVAPAVRVSDQYGNPVPNVSVTFAVGLGGGVITGPNAITNAGGIDSVGSWTLGFARANSLTATAAGGGSISGNPITFDATANDFWSTKTSMPAPREQAAAGVVNGILYVVGGHDVNEAVVGTVEAYDPASDSWTTKASMPTPRLLFNAIGVVNGILYAVGGNSDGVLLATIEAYNPATNSWTTKASMPTPLQVPSVAVVNGILYVIGGNSYGGTVGTVEAYDPASDSWTTRASTMPTLRTGVQAGVVNGIIYVVGGVDANNVVGTVEAYDPATDSWTTKASMPTALALSEGGVVNGILYVASGDPSIAPGTAPVGTVEAYDPASDSWTSKASIPTPRLVATGGVVNGIVYVVGGRTFNGVNVHLGTVEAYQP